MPRFLSSVGLPDQARIWDHVRATPVAQVQVTSDRGNAAQAIAGAARRLQASYDFGINSDKDIICYDIRLYGFRGKYESPADTASTKTEPMKALF